MNVGPTARHALIEADADIWSGATDYCQGALQLAWDATERNETNTTATAVPPSSGVTKGKASMTTSALPLLPAGPQIVQLLGETNGPSCVGFQDTRLNVILLNN